MALILRNDWLPLICSALVSVPFVDEQYLGLFRFSHTELVKVGAVQPTAVVGISMYWSILGVAFRRVRLKPGPSRLVI